MVKSYFDLIQEELLIKRSQLQLLTDHPSVQGTFYEDIFKDFLRRHIPNKYSIKSGFIVYNGKISKQIDIIIYDNTESYPIFYTDNLVLIEPESVKVVIEVKSSISSSNIKAAISNMKSAIDVFHDSQIKKLPKRLQSYIVAFESKYDIDTLNRKCKDEGLIGGFAFEKSSDKSLIKGQYKALLDSIAYSLKYGSEIFKSETILENEGYLKRQY